jgi:hypothetical protein
MHQKVINQLGKASTVLPRNLFLHTLTCQFFPKFFKAVLLKIIDSAAPQS